MSNIVNIVVVVNVTGAVQDAVNKNGNVSAYVYLMDDSDTLYNTGSNTTEGSDELLTYCQYGDTLRWQIHSIDPSQTVAITGINGDILAQLDFNPQGQSGGTIWTGKVRGTGEKVQYSLQLQMNNSINGWFDPYVTATNPPSAKN